MGTINARLLGAVALSAALLAAAWAIYAAGHTAGEDSATRACTERLAKIEAQHSTALQQAEQRYNTLTEEAVAAEREYWEQKQKTRVIYETIEKEVVRYIESDDNSTCKPDADFLRIWRNANANRNTAEASASQ